MKTIKDFFQYFFHSKIFLIILGFSLILNLASWVIFRFGLDFDKTALILHYNSFFGIDRIVVNSEDRKFLDIFFASFGGLLVIIINYILGMLLVFSSRKFLPGEENISKPFDLNKMPIAFLGGYFLFFFGLILQIVILVYTMAIVLVNR